jgi:hypothetical protein
MEIDDSLSGQEIQCPSCGVINALPGERRRYIERAEPVLINPREHIKVLRQDTCYGALRTVITIGFGIAYLFLGLGIVGGLIVGFVTPGKLAAMFIAITVYAVLVVLTMAAHQAVLLLIDIADAVIYSSAKS